MARRTLQFLVSSLIALTLGLGASSPALAQDDDGGGEEPTTVRVALSASHGSGSSVVCDQNSES